MYIFDTDHELDNRLKHFKNLDKVILEKLQNLMHQYNPFISSFKQFALHNNNMPEYKIILKHSSNKDRRTHNIPSSSEIAAIIPSNN